MTSLTQRINSYIAILIITLVGSLAALALMRVADGSVPVYASVSLYKIDSER